MTNALKNGMVSLAKLPGRGRQRLVGFRKL